MTTVWAWLYIPQVWNMLRQLSSSHEIGQSTVIYPSSMNKALSVDIVSWQRSEHGYISLKYEICSVSCHRLMTTDIAWLFIPKVWNMLCWLSSLDNGLSMVIYPSGMEHAPSVVIVSCQWTEHGYLYLKYETCSVSWHRLMTTVRAWLYIHQVWNMPVVIVSGMKHAPSVVIVSCQLTEHGYLYLKYETCSVSWHRLMTTVWAWLYIPHAPSVVIVSWQQT